MLFLKKKGHLLILYLILFFIVLFLYKIRVQLKTILDPFIVGVVLAYLFNPLVNYIEKKLKGIKSIKKKSSRLLAVIILYVFLLSIMMVLGWKFMPALIIESRKMLSDLPDHIKEVQETIISFRKSSLQQLPDGINKIIDANIERIEVILVHSLENISMFIVDFFSRILNIIMIPVLTFYFLKDKEYFINKLKLYIPSKWKSGILEVARKSDKVIGEFVRGRLIVGIFIGIVTSIGLKLLGIPYAVVIGLLAGILDIIPYFGPVFGAIPAVFIALLQNPVKVIWVILLFFVVQQVEGDIIAPKVIGEGVGLHPVTIILALLIGGTFFGIIGMIIAVPFAAILKVIVEHIVNLIATNDNY